MPKQILSGAKLYLGGNDLSGDANALALQYGATSVDQTTINQTSVVKVAGLKSWSASHAGFWSGGVGNVDETLFNAIQSSQVTTLCPTTGAEGERSFFGTAVQASYVPGGTVGDSVKFTVGMQGSAELWRGTVLVNGAKTATGTGTIMNLGAVTSLQRVAAALHVIGPVTGTSIAVTVQSAALVGFGSPTTRFTFTTAVGITAQQLPALAGPITDAFWRVSYTVVGGGASFPIIVSLAIQ